MNHCLHETRQFYILIDYRKEPTWSPLLEAGPYQVSPSEPEPFLYYTLAGDKVRERMCQYTIRQQGTVKYPLFEHMQTDWIKVSELDIAETEDLFATNATLFLYS